MKTPGPAGGDGYRLYRGLDNYDRSLGHNHREFYGDNKSRACRQRLEKTLHYRDFRASGWFIVSVQVLSGCVRFYKGLKAVSDNVPRSCLYASAVRYQNTPDVLHGM